MTDNEDENSSEPTSSPDSTADDQRGVSPDEPGVTPLGGNAGLHIHSTDEPDDPSDKAQKEADEPDGESIDFGGFIVGLGTSCMMNLGKQPNPETGENITDLPAATEVIEILEMLQRKTRGNLGPQEKQLLETLLHDLRRAYEETVN